MGSRSSTGGRRWWVVAGVLVILALLAWGIVSGLRAAQAARTLKSDMETVARQAQSLKMDEVAAAVPLLASDAQAFDAAVNGPLWAVLARVPVVGSAVTSAQDLAAASVSATDAAADLVPVLPLLRAENLRSADGQVDLAAMQRLSEALAAAQPDLSAAADRAAQADPQAIGPVGEAVATAQQQLVGLPQTAAAGSTGLDLAVSMLGAESPQRWMVILQNGSEARGTGGFLGAYGLVTADRGRMTVGAVDTNDSLMNTRIPNADMPRQFLDLWTRAYTSEWNSYNLSRHFPYTGQLSRNGMAARGTPVDNVIGIDAHVVAALLAGTGPITAGSDTVSADTAERFFNADVYAKYPDTAQKDDVVVALMNALLDRITTGDFDLGAAFSRLAPLTAANRVGVWSADADIQGRLEEFSVAGVVPTEPGPWVAAALNNSAGNKLDAFVASDVAYRASTCGTGLSTVTVTLTNNAPTPAQNEAFSNYYYPSSGNGDTRLWTAVYGPVGARFQSATIDGRRQYVNQGQERGHPVWRWNLDIPRGGSAVLTVRFREPASDSPPTVSPQAMAVPQTVSAVAEPCE